jgi:hypothetical protein
MANTLGFSGNSTIDQINAFVAQNEGFLQGPLTNMDNDGKQNFFTFDVAAGKPAKNTVISVTKAGGPVAPPNAKIVIQNGTILISTKPTPCFATRAN